MLRVCSAPAIAEKQRFVTIAVGCNERMGGRRERRKTLCDEAIVDFETTLNIPTKNATDDCSLVGFQFTHGKLSI
jgi:hypothetical protein